MVLFIKEWRKQWKGPPLYFSASIITIFTANSARKVALLIHFSHSSIIPFYIAEALYTDKIHVNFIPCLLESEYQPQGWLGIIIRDQLYIDFSTPENFDKALEELIAEIQAMEQRSSSESKFLFF